jgi:hypothetical protein
MFTGRIQEIGEIESVTGGRIVLRAAKTAGQVQVGGSLNVAGGVRDRGARGGRRGERHGERGDLPADHVRQLPAGPAGQPGARAGRR